MENENQYEIFLKAIVKTREGISIPGSFWYALFKKDLNKFQYNLLNEIINYEKLYTLNYQAFDRLLNERAESPEFLEYLVNQLLTSKKPFNYLRERIKWRKDHNDLASLNETSLAKTLDLFAFNHLERKIKILTSRYSSNKDFLSYIEYLYLNHGVLTKIDLPNGVSFGVHFIKRKSTLYVNIPYVFIDGTKIKQRPTYLDLHFSQTVYCIMAAMSRIVVGDNNIKAIKFVAQAVLNNEFIPTLTKMGFKHNLNPNTSDYPRNASQALFNVVPGKFFELNVVKKP